MFAQKRIDASCQPHVRNHELHALNNIISVPN